MFEASIKPFGSGIQYDNVLDKLLADPDHRGLVHCLVRASGGQEAAEIEAAFKKRSRLRKGGLSIGVRLRGSVVLPDRWREVSLEIWLREFTLSQPPDNLTQRDLRPVLRDLERNGQATLTLDLTDALPSVPDPDQITESVTRLLAAARRADIVVRVIRIHWSPTLVLVTIKLLPAGAEPEEPEDDYPIPSPRAS